MSFELRTGTSTRFASAGAIAICRLCVTAAHAVITPAADRAFSTNVAGENIIVQMRNEAGNPLLTPVVYLGNSDPNAAFGSWTGTLISSNWILTCAHTLQGTDGQGAGINVANLEWYSAGIPYEVVGHEMIAEFIVHPNWRSNEYSAGFDIALMRLAHPITNAYAYPRLAWTPFQAPTPIVFAGYGMTGDGDTGQTTSPPFPTLQTGINTLDGYGGSLLRNGYNQANLEHQHRSLNIALMDFDKLERREFPCNAFETVALADFSSMGAENTNSSRVFDPCAANGQTTVPGVFATDYNDFLPASGDSGGPAFAWNYAPFPPANGYYLNGALTVVGVGSSVAYGNANFKSRYGDVATYTLVEPYLSWIYDEAEEVGDRDSDGDGASDREEHARHTDPYDAASKPGGFLRVPSSLEWIYDYTVVPAFDAAVQDFEVLSVTEQPDGRSEVRFTLSAFNPSFITYREPSATIESVPEGFSLKTDFNDRLLRFASDLTPQATIQTENTAVVIVDAPASTAADEFLASAASFTIAIEGNEHPEFGTNVLVIDSSFVNSRIRIDGFGYWISNSPPHIHSVRPGWLAIPGHDLPTNVITYLPPFLPAFEVVQIQTNTTGEIGLKPGTNDLNWLRWLRNASFSQKSIGLGDSAQPREIGSHLPPTQVLTNDSGDAVDIPENSPPFDGLFNNFEVDTGVSMNASVGLGKLDADVDVKIRDSKPSLRLKLMAHPQWTATLRANATATFPRTEHEIFDGVLPPGEPFRIPVGPFEVSLSLRGRMYHGAQGHAKAGTEITLSQQSDFTATYVIDGEQSDFDYTWDPQPLDLTSPQLNLTAAMGARLFAGVELGANVGLSSAKIPIGSAEAGAYLEPYARVEVHPLTGPSWALYAGVGAGAYAKARLLLFPVLDKQYPILIEEKLVQGSSIAAAGTLSAASGSPGTNAANVIGTDSRWSKFWPDIRSVGIGYTDRTSLGMVLNESGNAVVGAVGPQGTPWVSELDRHGNSLWQKVYTGNGMGFFNSITRIPGDGYLMATSGDLVLTRLSDSGEVRWCRRYSFPTIVPNRFAIDARRDTNGQTRIYITGNLTSAAYGWTALGLSLDDAGSVLWARSLGTEGTTAGIAVHATLDGGVLVAGKCDADLLRCNDTANPICNDTSHNGFVTKLDANGNAIWGTICPANVLYDVVETPEGGALAVGATLTTVYDPYRGCSAHKFKADGSLDWQMTYAVDLARSQVPPTAFPLGDTDLDEARTITVTTGGYLLGGFTGADSGRYDKSGAWLIRVRENGEPLWYSMWDGPELEHTAQVVDRGDSFLMLGISGSFLPMGTGGTNALWLSALPHSGQLQFKPSTGVTTDYRHPLLDGFSGIGIIGTVFASTATSLTPTLIPLTVNTSTLNIAANDTWAPATELVQTLHDPAPGQSGLATDTSGTNVVIRWPVLGTSASGVEAADRVTGPWDSITNVIRRSGDSWQVIEPRNRPERYYRLRIQ
ncbi:MAG: trypsin-like serine protease [Verrucomicrobia bacterium]|nr:trypsin-like serine protease [Verrucomicrobiota bacterium]